MTDADFMREALMEARLAAQAGERPVGCVIARDGEIVARAHNECEAAHDATAHAEVEAIRQACQRLGTWRLEGCALYVTLEPCPMCAGAVINARIPTLVYGAKEPVTGSCGSVLNLFEERYGFRPAIYGGVLGEECAALMRQFFRGLRDAGEYKGENNG